MAKDVLKALAPFPGGKALQKGRLRLTDDLQAAGIEIVKKTDKLQTRTVHIRDRQGLGFIVFALKDDLHLKFINNILHFDRPVCIHAVPPFFG